MIKINSNTLAMEFDACARFGIDPYEQILNRSREWRGAIVGHFIGKQSLEAMKFHDTKPKPKKGKKH